MYTRIFWFSVIVMILNAGGLSFAGPSVQKEEKQAASGERTAYRSFVNVHYGWRRNLEAWQNTAEAIKATLQSSYTKHLKIGEQITDGTPDSLHSFLGSSQRTNPGFQINYVASVRQHNGGWLFPSGQNVSSNSILSSAADLSADSLTRLFIIDTCSAASFGAMDNWPKSNTVVLFASRSGELTHAVNFKTKQPLNLKKRYPQVHRWLCEHMPSEWEGTLSFTGLIWVKAFLAVDNLPQSEAEWNEFLTLCRREARKFAREHSSEIASTITVELSQ